MRAWRVRRRRSTGCGSGRGLCCWRRTAWRAERSDGRLDVQPARRRSGGCVTPRSGLRVSTKRASGALSRSARPRRTSASWGCWIKRRRRVMRAGQGPLLAAALDDVDVQYVWRFLRAQKIDLAGRKSWCERRPGSSPKPPTWSGSTWHRPRTPSSSALTRSPRSRRWSGHRAISSSRTAGH